MRQIEESPTRASTRAITRIAMLSKLSDRVQQSQEDYQTLHTDISTQQNAATIPSQNVRTIGGMAHEKSLPINSRRYDIETLIEIGSTVQDYSEVLLKIKPEAIAGKCHFSSLSLRPFPARTLRYLKRASTRGYLQGDFRIR